MTHRDDIAHRYADILGEQSPPAVHRLVTTLDAACTPAPSPQAAQLDAAMTRMLHGRSTAQRHPLRARRGRSWAWTRRRLAALAAVLLLTFGGLTGYLRLNPLAVSAQTVLHRAAALHLTPNQVAHFTYRVSTAGGYGGTADVWIQANASGAPTLSAQSLTMARNGTMVPGLTTRLNEAGQQVYIYDPTDNTIRMNPSDKPNPITILNGLPNDVFDGARVARYLSTLAQGPQHDLQLLPQQTLAGHTVDGVEWSGGDNQRITLYFDAQSYLLRGFDLVDRDGRSWQARLSTDETMALSAVPADTFTLHAPATARVIPTHPAPDTPGSGLLMDGTSASAFAAACHTSMNVKEVLWSSWGKSPLAACQATNPTMTPAGLVAALSSALTGPDKADLDAAVAAGAITPAQEAATLTSLHAQLTTWVTAPATSGPKPPAPPGGWDTRQPHR